MLEIYDIRIPRFSLMKFYYMNSLGHLAGSPAWVTCLCWVTCLVHLAGGQLGHRFNGHAFYAYAKLGR